MVKALAVLLLFQCLGETISFVGNIPIPGPVIGMLLLLAALRLSKTTLTAVEEPSLAFLKHLSLLFVPAGAGIVVYAGRVESDFVPIAATIVIGTALTVCITAITAQALHRIFSSHVEGLPQNVMQAATADGKPGEL
ncbi:LrgA family protein [Burkholderia sp. 8Y]|uniref:CidA/LrgA family protein n=1 Tax=Burkholderia sp. 8Y TaxID=2653133 RepID=UPI0012F405E9|nr:CidA/LrgA family protein [Burkholderia sp. 8Y]VXC86068.1 LrgA family protein [Burkholderia sp. 8Y]